MEDHEFHMRLFLWPDRAPEFYSVRVDTTS